MFPDSHPTPGVLSPPLLLGLVVMKVMLNTKPPYVQPYCSWLIRLMVLYCYSSPPIDKAIEPQYSVGNYRSPNASVKWFWRVFPSKYLSFRRVGMSGRNIIIYSSPVDVTIYIVRNRLNVIHLHVPIKLYRNISFYSNCHSFFVADAIRVFFFLWKH